MIMQFFCFGFSDGLIVIVISNGLLFYEYDFNDGNGFQSNNMLNNIFAGIYQVDVLDVNFCVGFFEFIVEDYLFLSLDFDIVDVSCFGESDGSVSVIVDGGFGSYFYVWSNGVMVVDNNNLVVGIYLVVVNDENGCEISDIVIVIELDSFGLVVIDIVDNICFGESNGSIMVEVVGGILFYEYSVDGEIFQVDFIFVNLFVGNFMVIVLDVMGCMVIVDVSIM